MALGTFQVHYSALKFLYQTTLNVSRPLFAKKKIYKPQQKRLPHPLTHASIPALRSSMRQVWLTHRHPTWLFPAQRGTEHLPADTL